MIKSTLFVLFLCALHVLAQTANITNCQNLQDVILNTSSVTYTITNDIDCSGFNFTTIGSTTIAFKGIIINFFCVGQDFFTSKQLKL